MDSQSAKDMGSTRALYGILYGPYMGTAYGTETEFATRFHVVPTRASLYGSHSGFGPSGLCPANLCGIDV